jgi:flavin reductase (DIM6/NTAB) family NADH-FMN oxidoreductase RutF
MKQSIGAKTLAVPTPVWLVGTFDKYEKPNIMTAAWGGICCSRPPCIQISLRKATYTHGNIMKRKSFTVNIPGDEHWREADYAGIISGRDSDKITDLEWSVVKSNLVDAPYIDQCKLIIECRLKETIELGLHTMFVGEIMDVKVDPEVITDKQPDISKIRPVIFSPGERYYFSIGDKLSKAFQQRTLPKKKV